MIIIKKKSILVIILSCIVSAMVFIITLAGFYVYLDWKTEDNDYFYKKSLHEVNAKLFEQYILVSPVTIKIGSADRYRDRPIFEGHIVNKSSRRIGAIKLKVSILNKDNIALYVESFYPLYQGDAIAGLPKKTGNFLEPGDGISYKHILRACPKDILIYLRMRSQLSRSKNQEPLFMAHKIESVMME